MLFLYLHGFASGSRSSKALFLRERLAERGVKLTVPELDGGDFARLTVTKQLQIIENVAGEQAVTLIGSSMGGYLAALYAGRHPSVKKLLLLAPAFEFLERWPRTLGPAVEAEWRRTEYMDVYHYGQKQQVRLHVGLLDDAAQYDAYPSFDQPALILHGKDDDVVPVANSERYAAEHPNVRLEVVPGGHEMVGVLKEVWRRAESFLLPA